MRSRGSEVVSERDPRSVLRASEVIRAGGIVVAPTDTIYGILADATNYGAVKRLRSVRRPSGRPFLLIVPDVSWVGKIGLTLGREHLRLLSVPGVTVVLKRRVRLYHWLGRETVAVRIPRRGFVLRLVRHLGRPVVAPSANPEGKPPARTVEEAMEYFRDEVSLYVDGGRVEGRPSAVVRLEEGGFEILRTGVFSPDSLKRLRPRPPFPG